MNTDNSKHRLTLQRIGRRVMLEKALLPDFPVQALAEIDTIQEPSTRAGESTRDFRNLLWCSIDNGGELMCMGIPLTTDLPGTIRNHSELRARKK